MAKPTRRPQSRKRPSKGTKTQYQTVEKRIR